MDVQTFAVICRVPKGIHNDEELLWQFLYGTWYRSLDESGAVEATGPLFFSTVGFSFIDDYMCEIITGPDSPLWIYAHWKIMGPASR
jgi:hypothetical protein